MEIRFRYNPRKQGLPAPIMSVHPLCYTPPIFVTPLHTPQIGYNTHPINSLTHTPTMTPDQTPIFDSPMRSITVQIPTPVAHKINETFEGTLEDAALAGLKLINGMGPATYSDLMNLSKQSDTSPAKLLRAAIKLLIAETIRLQPSVAPTVGRPRINQERDAKLYARIKAGFTQAQVAAEFNLSIVRVGQIAARHRLLNGDAPRGRIPKLVKPLPAQQPEPEEVLSLKAPEALAEGGQPTPPQPRKLAVIPPSMRDPELFRKAEERPQPVPPAEATMDMFSPDFPFEEAFGLKPFDPNAPRRVAPTSRLLKEGE